MPNRRDTLKTGAALTYAAGAGLTLTLRPAAAAAHGSAFTPAQRFSFGDTTVVALSDGFLEIGPGILQGIDEAGFAALATAALLDPDRAKTGAVNAYAIQRGNETTLIDAGTGTVFGPTLG